MGRTKVRLASTTCPAASGPLPHSHVIVRFLSKNMASAARRAMVGSIAESRTTTGAANIKFCFANTIGITMPQLQFPNVLKAFPSDQAAKTRSLLQRLHHTRPSGKAIGIKKASNAKRCLHPQCLLRDGYSMLHQRFRLRDERIMKSSKLMFMA